MMNAAQQHRHLGVSACASDDLVIVQVGTAMTALTPADLRTFLKCAARELFRAEIIQLERQLEKAAKAGY